MAHGDGGINHEQFAEAADGRTDYLFLLSVRRSPGQLSVLWAVFCAVVWVVYVLYS
jgi:hypothetical protein